MTLSSPAGSFAASLGSQENRDRIYSCLLFFVLTKWTRKADEDNSPVDCYPAVAREGESNFDSFKTIRILHQLVIDSVLFFIYYNNLCSQQLCWLLFCI